MSKTQVFEPLQEMNGKRIWILLLDVKVYLQAFTARWVLLLPGRAARVQHRMSPPNTLLLTPPFVTSSESSV